MVREYSPIHLLYTGLEAGEAFSEFSGLDISSERYGMNAMLEEAVLAQALKGKSVYMLGGNEQVSPQVIRGAKALKLIVYLGTDCEPQIPLKVATECGIAVCNLPASNSTAVAEYTVGMILAMQRRFPFFLASGLDTKAKDFPMGHDSEGKTLGIMGMGMIGSHVARIASKGLGMRVIYWSRTRKPEIEAAFGMEWRTFEEVLEQSDVLSLHLPGSSSKEKPLLGKQELLKMKKEALLINAARPYIVDGDALYEMLLAGKLRGAVIDGFYSESGTEGAAELDARLLTLGQDKLMITPHMAWMTQEAHEGLVRKGITYVKAMFFGKGELTNLVNPEYRESKRS